MINQTVINFSSYFVLAMPLNMLFLVKQNFVKSKSGVLVQNCVLKIYYFSNISISALNVFVSKSVFFIPIIYACRRIQNKWCI